MQKCKLIMEEFKDAEDYYRKTRMVETRNWSLQMAINFAEEYHEVMAKGLTTEAVNNSDICDDWIHGERVKFNDDNYCPICGKQLQIK
jgi:rubrerythrin